MPARGDGGIEMNERQTTVRTTHGSVRGLAREGSIAFYGIPYAAAPVGDRAFAPPELPESWTGERDATVPGPTAQIVGFDGGTIPEPSVPGDDVLTVNVFTPEPSTAAALPVLVWFHGGAFIAGSPVSPWYDGASFNRDGVVVVTVGYRLGVAGFADVEGAPPNRAALDWLAALRWVQENIAAFGGDPARVTIAGQSAGGGAVLTLLAIDEARSMLGQAIACSPVFTRMTPAGAARAARELGHLLGEPTTADAVGQVSRGRLSEVVWELRNAFGRAPDEADATTDAVSLLLRVLTSLELSPVIDGRLVQRPVAHGVMRAGAAGVPLLIGSAAEEFNGLIPRGVALPDDAKLLALESFGIGWGAATRYLQERADLEGSELTGQLLTDLMMRAPIPFLADRRERTWVYDFRWKGRGELDPGRAFHCLDLPFAWGTTGASGAARATGPVPESLTADVHGAWVRFIGTGDPGWAPYRDERTVRCFDEPTRDVIDGYAVERLLGRAAADLGLIGERGDDLARA